MNSELERITKDVDKKKSIRNGIKALGTNDHAEDVKAAASSSGELVDSKLESVAGGAVGVHHKA